MSITLDSIRAAAARKYASTDIELGDGRVAVLHNPLRLGKAARKQLAQVSADMKAAVERDEDEAPVLENALRIAGKGSPEVEELIELIGGDLGILIATFEQYGSETELGEASASES